MAYNLYIDAPQSIKCKAEITGAEGTNTIVRLMVETSGRCLYFKGSISETGDIEIPMNAIKDIIKESTQGKLMLEMIVDDTVFVPWQTDFIAVVKKKVAITEVKSDIERHTKETTKRVQIVSTPSLQKANLPTPTPPVKEARLTTTKHAAELIKEMRAYGITYKNIAKNTTLLKEVIDIYFKDKSLTGKEIVKIKDILIKNIEKL